MWYPEKDITSSVHLLVEKEFNHMETSDNHKIRNFLFLKKGGGTVSFKNVNVLKNTNCGTIPNKRRLKRYDS